MSDATIRLNLQDGGALSRAQRFALESARVRESWGSLPGNLQLAQGEMLRLGAVQVRLGHLRHRDRRDFRAHAEYVRQHQAAVRQHVTALTRFTSSSPHLTRYESLLRSGGLAEAVGTDPEIERLHRAFQNLGRSVAQHGAMAETGQMLGSFGAGGGGGGAGYWIRRGMFGAHPDGAPRTAGEWAVGGAKHGYRRATTLARQATGIFAAFRGLQMLTESMRAFEERAELGQTLGSQMAGSFTAVGKALDDVRKQFAFTRRELAPGIRELVKMTGSLAQVTGSTEVALALGLGPSAVMSQVAHMTPYGPVAPYQLWQGAHLAGMRGRPELYFGMVESAQRALGQGYHQLPQGLAQRYAAGVSQWMGPAYQGPRGSEFIGQLVAGTRGAGNDYIRGLKLNAIRGLKIAGMPEADTGTWSGLQMALQSGSPEVLQALYQQATRYGGAGEPGLMLFQKLTDLPMLPAHRLFRGMARTGGRIPSKKDLAGVHLTGLDAEVAAAKSTEAYRHRQVNAEMESKVLEPLGAILMPVANDFKNAGLQALDAIQRGAGIFQALTSALQAVGSRANSPHTTDVFSAMMLANFGWMGGVADIVRRLADQDMSGRTETIPDAPPPAPAPTRASPDRRHPGGVEP